ARTRPRQVLTFNSYVCRSVFIVLLFLLDIFCGLLKISLRVSPRPLLCSGPAVRPACRKFSGVFVAPGLPSLHWFKAALAMMIRPASEGGTEPSLTLLTPMRPRICEREAAYLAGVIFPQRSSNLLRARPSLASSQPPAAAPNH